jgi:arsenate reductase (glutaredoxin)
MNIKYLSIVYSSREKEMKAVIYHNPKCSKSTFALEYLKKHSIDVDIKLYMTKGITLAEVYDILELLDCDVTDIIRVKEHILMDPDIVNNMLVSKEGLIKVITENPFLLERPIVLFREKGIGAIVKSEESLINLLKQVGISFDINIKNTEINKKTESNKDKVLEQDIV